MIREKWGCLEINWNTGTTGTLFFSPRLLKCCDASFLQGPSLPRMSFSLRPFLWWPFPSLAPAICSKLRQQGISVSLRLIPPSSPVISRYLTLSHPIASYRTIELAERLNFAAWTRFLGRPASRLATADVRLPCRIQVSTVFDILTHKGRAQPVTGQAPPSAPKREKKWFFRKMEWIDVDTQKKQLEQLLQQVTTLSVSHEQNWACSSYAMARKSAMKWNSFARTSPLRGPCGQRLAARETTMNNASPWTRFLLIVLA